MDKKRNFSNHDTILLKKNRQIHQWNGTESQPNKYSQLILDKGAKLIQWNKDKSFKQILTEQLDIHTHTQINLHTHLTELTKL